VSLLAIDASVAVKLFFAEAHSNRAIALFQHAALTNDQFVAPPLLPVEVTTVIRD